MKSYLRFLSRNKLYTAIEVAGLGIALAFVVFIATFVAGELGYDKDLRNTENIYVGHEDHFSIMSYTAGDLVKETCPEVEQVCRFLSTAVIGGVALEKTVGEETTPQNAIIADTSFFRFFTFPFVEGRGEDALSQPDAVVVSESFAKAHWGGKSPLGEKLQITVGNGKKDLFIAGVYEDIKRSVFPKAEIIYGTHHIKEMYPDLIREGNGTAVSFYRITAEADLQQAEEKALATLKEKDILFEVGLMKNFYFSPFSKIHYGITVQSFPFEGIINFNFVMLFLAAGILLLVFALFNYISLTVAQIGFRANEMATRRLLGEQKWEIASRYIKEALLLTAFSFVLALLLIEVFGPYAEKLVGKEISLVENLGIWEIVVMVASVFVVSLLAGIIPAMLVAKYKPIDVVKGEFAVSGRMVLGKVFIGVQNVVAISTLCIALAMFVQFRHLLLRDSGYTKDNLITLEGAQRGADYYPDELLQLPFVEELGWVQSAPVHTDRSGMGMSHRGEQVQLEGIYGDSTAFRMLGFNVVSLNGDVHPSDGTLWLTEGAMKGLGLDYSDRNVVFGTNDSYGICGVIRDYQKGNRTMEDCASSNIIWWNMEYKGEESFPYMRRILLKVSGDEDVAAAELEKFYRERDNGSGINVYPLNRHYRRYFTSEENNLKLITAFTGLVILLSAMAMLAMSTYYTRQQSRNWSVRKVFGCGRGEVFRNMALGFLKVVGASALLAVPLGYIVVDKWLAGYSYRIDNHWWLYLFAVILVASVAVASITWQAVRLMNSNPIKELKQS